MKRLFVFALLAVMACAAQAQRFEWAKGFTVSNEYRPIVGGITDSLGNLYILGNCDASSVWDGAEYILPSINKTAKDLPNNVLIAKISTEGEMVWKKVIFANQNGSSPYDIKKIGDTSFACIMDFYGNTDLGYLYFLDTFLVTPTNYPIDVRYFRSAFLAYLVFDFDGNVKEQHFLTITFTDVDGNDIVYRPSPSHADTTPWLKGIEKFRYPSFDVDDDGNIYIGRFAVDKCSGAGYYDLTPEDSIRGLKFWVDGRLVGEYRIEGRPSLWFPQVIKFSPHFDTLLDCRYVIQKWNIDGHTPFKTNIKVDMNGNVYFIPLYLANSAPGNDTIVVDSLLHMGFVRNARGFSFLTSYSQELNTRWIITYDDNLIDETRRDYVHNVVVDIDFDYDSNLVFLSATSGRRTSVDDTIHYNSVLSYRGRTLPLKDGVSIASFYNTDSIPVMHSYSVVPSIVGSQSVGWYGERGNLYCKNNRVVLQCDYFGGIRLPSQTIRYNTVYHTGIGLMVFDYMGNLIDGIDYGCMLTNCNTNYPGPIVAHDSVLYLCNLLKTNAQFGDISFPVYGETNVIAKYVDTAFMHPYVRPTHGISTVSAVAPRVYPVPATDRLHFDCPAGDVPTAVAAISLSGWRMPLTATASSADVSCLAPGVYLLEITTAKDKYYTKFLKR